MSFEVLYSTQNPKGMKSELMVNNDITSQSEVQSCRVTVETDALIINLNNRDLKKFPLNNTKIELDEISQFDKNKFGVGLPVNKLPLLELKIGREKIYLWNFTKPEETIKLKNKLTNVTDTPYAAPKRIDGVAFGIFINLGMILITVLVVFYFLPESITKLLPFNLYIYGGILLIISSILGYLGFKKYREDYSQFSAWLNTSWYK